MAHYFEYATKDTTLYERSGSQNAGLDEILEIAKDVSPANRLYGVSRALIKFDLTYISSSYSAGTFGNNPKFYLNLFDANTRGIQSTQTLFAYAVTQSWENGYGRSDSNPRIGEGASWNFRDSDTLKTQWTGSMTASGGHWNTLYSASQVFDQEAADMRMDVTNLVLLQLSGSANGGVENEGFIIKREGNVGNSDTTTAEGSGTPLGTFSFFSRETHTIYQPKLEVVWNDSKWVTGSLSALTSEDLEDLVLYARGLKKQYREDSKIKFRLIGRPLYPEKTFSATAGYDTGYNTAKYLPSGSIFYQVKDAFTEDVIIPYGNGSKISCDSVGNYFNLDLKPLLAERFYKVEVKVVSGSGTADEMINFYTEIPSFKVVK